MMFRATVPKTAVKEYGDAQLWKNEIRGPSDALERSSIHIEPQAKRVNGPTQFEFWPSVTPSVRLHTYAHTG